MRSFFNLVTEAHVLFTLLFLFSSFTLAKWGSWSKKEELPLYKNMLLPGLIILTVFLLSNSAPVYKTVLLAELVLYAVSSVSALIKRSLHSYLSLILGIGGSLFLIFSPGLNDLFHYNLRWFCLAHILSIALFLLVELKQKGSNKAEKIHIANALSSVILLFSNGQDAAFFMLAVRLFYFVTLFKALQLHCKQEREDYESKLGRLKEDFDDAVRLEVKTQLFYTNLSKEKMAEIAKLDDLTKTYNKKTILNAIKDKIADKKIKTFSLLIFDIDKFKNINDSFGHIQGDKCIVELANIAKDSLRENDMLGRYGGDEFFALIHEAELHTAVQVAERLRKNVEKTEDPHYTISIGIANYPTDALTDTELIKYADEGLYIAKEKGRNALGYLPKNKNVKTK